MTRASRPWWLVVACLCACASACSSDPKLSQIVVVVDSDLKVPSELDHLSIDVSGATNMPHASAALASQPLPRSLGLVHTGGPLGPIVVRVRGLLGSDVVVERSAQVSFTEGRSLELRIALERSCVGMLSCGDGMTCVDGACASAQTKDLPGWSGKVMPFESDGGTDASSADADAATTNDGGGSSDASNGMDGATPANLPPTCTITSPAAADTFLLGDAITFDGSCSDPETGALTKGLSWDSDVDGTLGLRARITRTNLSQGTHQISLCANDPADTTLQGCSQITIEVQAPNVPAIKATIESIKQSGSTTQPFGTGSTVSFSGSGMGSGALTYGWYDSLAGALSTNATASLNTPSMGKHTVTFTVQDALNRKASASAAFTVLALGSLKLVDTFTAANLTFSGNGSARIDVVSSDANGMLYVADGSKQVYTVATNTGSHATAAATLALASPPSPDVVQRILLHGDSGLAYLATKQGYMVCDYALATGIDGSSCSTYAGGSLPNDDVTSIARIRVSNGGFTDYLIVGTTKGVFRATNVDGASSGVTRLNDTNVSALSVSGNRVWVATRGDGLYAYDPATNQTSVHTQQDDGAPSDTLTSLAVGSLGAVWVGSSSGLGRYVPSTDTWTTWGTGDAPSPGLVSNEVRAIAVAHPLIGGTMHDVIWIATSAGVSRFDPTIPAFTTFTTSDGLPSNSVRVVAVLPSGAIAFGTDAGLAIYAGP